MKTKKIQELICKTELLKHNIPCENVKYLFSDWENDVLSLNKSGYLTEFEVKISVSDFKADSKKRKWMFFEKRIETQIPNYFYYVCPHGLINKSDIPEFAGLIYIDESDSIIIKKAKILHRFKHDEIKILTKFSRVMSERKYLGSCLLTYKNKK